MPIPTMWAMATIAWALLTLPAANAYVILGSPQQVSVVADKLQNWTLKAQYTVDSKMSAFLEDPSDKNSKWIFNSSPDFRLSGTTNLFNDVTAPAGANRSEYPDCLPYREGINYVEVNNTIPIPPAKVTGARDNGTNYDKTSIWMMNIFRLSETSQPNAPSTHLIGFAHNEDYWGAEWASPCTYKSIGVRYSTDLGMSWTRSVPILTKLVQEPFEDCTFLPQAGTGDFAAMWNSSTSTWVIFAQEEDLRPNQQTSLVMSVSNDTLARPYTWNRLDPASGATDPGFLGGNRTLMHPDLHHIPGSNPSIIRDDKNGCWHMVYVKWGGGLVYTNSTNLARWTYPTLLSLNDTEHPSAGYPTLIGDRGDTLTTDGTATLYFKDAAKWTLWGQPTWSVGIDFNAPKQQSAAMDGVHASEDNGTLDSKSQIQFALFEDL
ncbi:uncharacterized protein KY384_001309 [Bacidia gigantensis]|uniref:uncharacterized protein n=1 Tax=Bacidia gigantensis TaxID=2732470 RepID=UPI001D05473A|nr:uncharacterized protein KY384_001309 [Bacidia gigantensis]KAG8533569.1 hypothetical protein KY384_001309 [Bacidia gigantensis]